jgi:hypothetical protein
MVLPLEIHDTLAMEQNVATGALERRGRPAASIAKPPFAVPAGFREGTSRKPFACNAAVAKTAE